MGGCASKPKDLDTENTPDEAEAEAENSQQEKHEGVETKKGVEPLDETIPVAESKSIEAEAQAVVEEEKKEAPQSEVVN